MVGSALLSTATDFWYGSDLSPSGASLVRRVLQLPKRPFRAKFRHMIDNRKVARARISPMKLSAMLVSLIVVFPTWAQDTAATRVAVQREKQPLLDTLKELVSIESGSSDFDGVTRIGDRIAERMRALEGEV